MLRTILEEMRRDGNRIHRLAADLVEIADRHTMTLRGVVQFPDLMKEAGLKPKEITDEVFAVANSIERRDRAETSVWLEQINRTQRKTVTKKSVSPVVRIIRQTLIDERISEPWTLKSIFKIRKQLLPAGVDAELITEDLLSRVLTHHQETSK